MQMVFHPQPSDSLILVSYSCLEDHFLIIPAIQTHLSQRFDFTVVFSAYAGTGLRRRSSISPKIFWNRLRDKATSANWKVT